MSPLRGLLTALALLTLGACDVAPSTCGSPRRVVPADAEAPLFSDLGAHTLPITTAIPLAQRYFDQGLVLAYGFNHEEALRSFREAQRLDPSCAMCAWGEAYALGPNINRAMQDEAVLPAFEAALRAQAYASAVAPLERALIAAMTRRYSPRPGELRAQLDLAYADAMRGVAKAHPDQADALALFAEAQLDTSPWDYYEANDTPKPRIAEAIAALERALSLAPDHPGANHFYVHAVEKHAPELGEAAADRLRDLVPGAGHLVHMPSHIYLRLGRYADASLANENAAEADYSYITQCRAQGFYPSNYYPHNLDFLLASTSFEGRSRAALEAARKLERTTPPEAVEEYPNVEEFMPRRLFARLRFGRWRQVLATPEPPAGLPYMQGAWHYARGVARAAGGELEAARQELRAVRASQEYVARKDERIFLSGSTPAQLLEIAELVLSARIDSTSGQHEAAIRQLVRAVALEEALPYAEPPPWHFPVRDALGQAQLDAGRNVEAERSFRAQLQHTPNSGWSLFGLSRSLRAQGRDAEASEIERRFADAWQRADISLERSVF